MRYMNAKTKRQLTELRGNVAKSRVDGVGHKQAKAALAAFDAKRFAK
jgi:hypothetical protein